MMTRLYEVWKWLSVPPREPVNEQFSEWGSGLVVDAPAFSSQLRQLQRSLAPHDNTALRHPVENAAVEVPSESIG
ncbi:MAG: hypothetical protein M3N93_09390 [Acidobacteriota bacterium]|nr:hypothetical protein [Acidobacteriota bacterium]